MKIRNLIVYNLIFLACVLATIDIVRYQLTGDHLMGSTKQSTAASTVRACTNTPAPERLATSDIQLKAVVEYEAACQSAFIDQMMTFTNMPVSTDDAQQAADKMAIRLKAFASFGIKPMVVVEPDSEWGLVDFHEFATGFYDEWITAYFARLKANGISDQTMGTWIPFPEPQQEFWNNNKDPDDFANSVNRYFKMMRASFPQSSTALLLDSQVGETEQASQLLAYTRLVDNSLVNSFGLQGFPWHPKDQADERLPVTSASVFAPASLADEVAKSVGTKEIILNVGTYRHRKAADGGDIAVTTAERQATLDSIVTEADKLRDKGYKVTVNIFAENKLTTKEGVDWSYWQKGDAKSSSHTVLFTKFVHDLKEKGVSISLFDSRE